MARQSMCANHRDQPAVARCLHCNRSICEQCTREITGGRFCSEEHAERYLQFAMEQKPIKLPRHMGCTSKIVLLILAAGVIALGAHLFGFNVPYLSDALGPSPLINEETVVPAIPAERRTPRENGAPDTPDASIGDTAESPSDAGNPPAQPQRDPSVPTPYQF